MSRLARLVIALTGKLVSNRLSADVMGGMEERWHRDRRRSLWHACRGLLGTCVSTLWYASIDPHRPLGTSLASSKGTLMTGWLQDFRYAVRGIRLAPGVTLLVVLTMALGIGANTAVFSAVYAIVLKPLPYPQPDRLMLLSGSHPQREPSMFSVSLDDYRDWARSARSFESTAGFAYWTFNLTGTDAPLRIVGGRVTPDFFDMLGTAPLLGRSLGRGDEHQSDRVVLSRALWRRAFNDDPGVIGRTISLNGISSEIVGVMPESFRFPEAQVEIWAPLGQELTGVTRMARFLMAAGRLAPGVRRVEAQTEMQAIANDLAAKYPDSNRSWSIVVSDARGALVRDVRQPLILLLLASALVLAIACANLANLLLSRASARRRECAIRVALGASRLQLLRQFLIESLLLAGLGAVAGVAVAQWGIAALVKLQPADVPRVEEVALHPAVLLFALGCALVAGVIFGVVPALHASGDTERALRETSLTTTASRAQRARRMFVIAEIALACVLVIGGLLLLRSFSRVTGVDPGFRADGLSVVRVFLGPPRYRRYPEQNAYVDRALERIRALPGVTAIAAGTNLPLGDDITREPLAIEGRPDIPEGRPRAELRAVTPGYFRALGIPLLEGREVDSHDNPTSHRVIVINRSMARQLWPGEHAVGKKVRWAAGARDPSWMNVVGVVDDVAGSSLEEPEGPVMYIPYQQRNMPFLRWATIVARTDGDASAFAETMRRSLREVDPDLPIFGVEALSARFDEAVAPRRFGLMMLGLFAGLALLIALAGVYGVVAFAVAQRRREMSVRLALGAEPSALFGLVLRDGARMTMWGMGIGLVLAWAAGRRIESLLFGVAADDAVSFGVAAAAIAVVALSASAIPAWRSMRISPSEALRE